MNEPLVCEDTDLDRLLETIRAEHGDAANILYQDSVRRGGVMGFFAQEVHRVVYRVSDSAADTTGATANVARPAKELDVSHDAVDMHPFEAMLAQQAKSVERPNQARTSKAAMQAEPAELEMPWLADLLDDEPDEVAVIVPPKPAPAKPAPARAARSVAAPAPKTLPSTVTAPVTGNLLDDELADESDSRVMSYAFPRAEPTARAFNNKPQATDELVTAADESENAMLATLEVQPLRMTAQERFAELLQAMEEAKAAEAEIEAQGEAAQSKAPQNDPVVQNNSVVQNDSVVQDEALQLETVPQAKMPAPVEVIHAEAPPTVEIIHAEAPPTVEIIHAKPAAAVEVAATDADLSTQAATEHEPAAAETPASEVLATETPAPDATAEIPAAGKTTVHDAGVELAPIVSTIDADADADTELSMLDRALQSMLADDTSVAPPATSGEVLSWPTIVDEPAEMTYEPFRTAQEPRPARHSAGEPDEVVEKELSAAPIVSAPVRENAQVVSLPATGTGDARARMDMMMRLREIGVPSSVNPSSEAANIYEALDEVLSELPTTPTPPRKPGDVLVIIGDIGPALRAAQSVARTLRLRDSDIWVADLESHPVVEIGGAATDNTHAIANPRHAARLRAELVQADVASVIVIATDGAEAAPNDPWIGEMLEALRPTAVWACVDATRKSSDTAARLALLGDIDALAVHSAAISSSPASVWDIGIPVALLDGRTAGVPTWAGLLLSLLSTEESTAETVEESDSRHSRAARHRSA